jgi:hypothetical protein
MPYIGKTTDGFGVRNRFVYLASSGATSVSGADANGATLTFTDGAYVDVYLNGILLKPTTDYNTSTANTIAGLSALNTNDEVTVVVYDVFTVADMVSATSGGTFSGAVTLGGGVTGDLDLNTDGSAIKFGADGEITLTHSADDGLILKHVGTGDGKEPRLTFQAGDTDIAVDDLLGSIEFQAPDEGTGTDSQLVAAAISAVSEGDFSASSNATGLRFQTGASETATTKMTLTSGGHLGLGTASPISYNSYGNGLVIAKTGAGASHSGMSLISATDGYGSIYFNDGTGNNTHGAIDYNHSTDVMRLRIAGSTAMTLDQSGKRANFGITGERAIINRDNLTGISLEDDASTTVAGFSGSSSALILVYDPGGGGAVFFATYQNVIAKLAGSSDYAATDSDGNTCVFKSSNSHSVTLKNREGSGTSYYVLILQAYD